MQNINNVPRPTPTPTSNLLPSTSNFQLPTDILPPLTSHLPPPTSNSIAGDLLHLVLLSPHALSGLDLIRPRATDSLPPRLGQAVMSAPAQAQAQGPVVVRLRSTDHGSGRPSFVLLQVSSAGTNALDVSIMGTENENVFAAELKHSQTSTFKTKNVGQDEWESVLRSILLGTDAEGNPVPAAEDVEAVATVDPTAMVVTIQKKIEGITQKLGIITLPLREDADGDLFEWCSSAVLARGPLVKELQVSKARIEEKDAQIQKLEHSLAEMARMKNENEMQLLHKFSLLLNEKKLKIRDQQRLLQCSKVDTAAARELEGTRLAVRPRPAGASRIGKRKADEPIEKEEEGDQDDEGLVKMEIDPEDDNDVVESGSGQEPDSDAETNDEKTASEDEDQDPVPAAPRKPARAKPAGSSRTVEEARNTPEPATKLVAAPPARAPAPFLDESETEDDDEL